MSSLPEEIYLQILLRVPAISTFACKCVCKTWFRLISDPNFVNLHLDHAIQTNKCSLMCTDGYDYYSISYDSLLPLTLMDDSDDDEEEFVDPLDDNVGVSHIYFPFRYDDELMCSCNGLLLFGSDKSNTCYLWNPFTKEYKDIPDFCFADSSNFMSAFGYDGQTDDYKMVLIRRCAYGLIIMRDDSSFRWNTSTSYDGCMVKVYTLGTNSWRNLEPIPYEFNRQIGCGVFVNGVFHWLGETQGQDVIISMDIGDESFRHIQIPDEAVESIDQRYCMNVVVLERCLSLFVHVDGKSELWVMQDYGVCESWARRYVINHENITANACWWDVRIMWSFENGEILLKIVNAESETYDLVIYDPKQGSARKANICGLELIKEAENHFGSLVSLGTGHYVGRR